jgi:formate--tetrahydrofolate ligase
MAIFCLTESWADLKQRIGDIVIGYDRSTKPVTARDLRAHGAMAALLRDALAPNLVQTLEGAPAFVHGGPFANIAHGCSSVMATRSGLRLADIVVASEVMAILCLADSLGDLKKRLGDVVVGYTRDKREVTARDLQAEGAMAVLLRDAVAPNLVQTLEHTPAFIHGGPFANIAHGCNSVMATRAALKLGDWVVTEAGFGADLGAEKFIDIKCRATGLRPEVAVVVVTVRALKFHGGVAVADVDRADLTAVGSGMTNLRRHLENIRGVYGLTPVVAVNRFPSDTDAEIDLVVRMCSHEGVRAYEATHVRDGGAGAEALARGVVDAVREGKSDLRFVYDDHLSLEKKAEAIATRVYGAAKVVFEPKARRRLDQIEAAGHGQLPICMAKTQSSFSTDASQRGAPSGHTIAVREVRLAAGAGFVVLVTGDIMTMPGLPKAPAAHRIDVDDDGRVVGLS